MSADKPLDRTPRTATPGSLLSQWWTLGDIILDRRTNGSGRHIKVAWVIIDRYMQAKGNGRASVRFIEQATGLSKGIIIKACRELVDWGYMTQRIGIGTRPTEYSPNWSSVSPVSNAKTISPSVPQESNTTDSSVSPESNESYLPEPADKAELRVSRNIDTHDALPMAALAGATAGIRAPKKSEPFDLFWLAFPRKFQKPKARAAWDKIAPDAELAEFIIEKASAWAEHYASHGTDKKWIPTPANWLAGERYDEDLPDVYVDPKEAAIAKAKDRGAEPPVKDTKTLVTDTMKTVLISSVEESGSWFGDHYHLTLKFADAFGNIEKYTLKILNPTPQGEPLNRDELALASYHSLDAAVGGWRIEPKENAGKRVGVRMLPNGYLEFEMDRSTSFAPFVDETVEAEIILSKMHEDDGEEFLEVAFMTKSGVQLEEWYATISSPDEKEQAAGQGELARLLSAIGIGSVNSHKDLLNKWVKLVRRGKQVVELLPYWREQQAA